MTTERCYFCNEDQPKIFSKVDDGVFLQCTHCKFVWLERSKWPTNQQEYYSTEYYPKGYLGRKDLRKLFSYRFKLIKRYFKPEGMLLEIGAASGDFLHLLQDSGYDVYGVELSKRAAEQAARNYQLDLSVGTLEDASFPADSFEYIVMYHVLEHLPDPRATLQEAYRILRPGGHILVEVPNVQSIDTLSRQMLLNVLDYPNHLYAFSPGLLKKILVESGFGVVTLEYSFPFIVARYLMKARRMFVRQGGISTSQDKRTPVTGRELFQQASSDSFLKHCVARIFPGMKVTIVGQK